MQIKSGWLIIEERDIVDITISMSTVQEVWKHWDDNRRRSFFCNQRDDCSFCAAGIPRRQRWQCIVFLDGQSLRWEFGADIYTPLYSLPGHDSDFMAVRVVRRGSGRMTKYDITYQPKSIEDVNAINAENIARRRQYLIQQVVSNPVINTIY